MDVTQFEYILFGTLFVLFIGVLYVLYDWLRLTVFRK